MSSRLETFNAEVLELARSWTSSLGHCSKAPTLQEGRWQHTGSSIRTGIAKPPPSSRCHSTDGSTGSSSEALSCSKNRAWTAADVSAVQHWTAPQPLDRSSADLELLPGLLDGQRAVHAVLVVQVYLVNAQACQGGLAGCPHVLGRAIHLHLACRG